MHLAVRRCTIPQHPPTEVHLFLSTVWAQDGSLCWAQVLLIGKAAEGDTARPREEYNRRPLYVGHKARSSNRQRPTRTSASQNTKHEHGTTSTSCRAPPPGGSGCTRARLVPADNGHGRGVETTSPYPTATYFTYIDSSTRRILALRRRNLNTVMGTGRRRHEYHPASAHVADAGEPRPGPAGVGGDGAWAHHPAHPPRSGLGPQRGRPIEQAGAGMHRSRGTKLSINGQSSHNTWEREGPCMNACMHGLDREDASMIQKRRICMHCGSWRRMMMRARTCWHRSYRRLYHHAYGLLAS